MEILLFLMGWPVAFLAGWFAHRRLNTNYKQRWITSKNALQSAIENGIVEKRVEIEERVVERLPESAEKEEIRKRLHKLAGWERQELEEARLEKGLAPVDDLRGLAGWEYKEMMQTRFDYGYDELGNRTKEQA
jgi:tRNA(Glu) U13 pseudouridine synthase TruD